MARDRNVDTQDRVVSGDAPREPLFRIYAVEPHGWSTVLIEDQNKKIYLCSTTAGTLSELSTRDAEELVNDRSYRRWLGSNDWAPLSKLPLLASVFGRLDDVHSAGAEDSAL